MSSKLKNTQFDCVQISVYHFSASWKYPNTLARSQHFTWQCSNTGSSQPSSEGVSVSKGSYVIMQEATHIKSLRHKRIYLYLPQSH